jgi:hypothetical protein
MLQAEQLARKPLRLMVWGEMDTVWFMAREQQ